MDKSSEIIRGYIKELYHFRSNIPANLSISKVKDVWGIDIKKESIPPLITPDKDIAKRKVALVEDSLGWLIFKPWVKFIGISGSVASDFAQKEDDIDLFFVVKNDTAWLYRAILYLRNLSKNQIRSKERVKKGEDVEDRFCINFITEMRALQFEEDIFNLNELIYLKPVYGDSFLKVIFINNMWLKERYLLSDKFLERECVKIGDIKTLTKRNWLLFIPNFLSFIAQLLFMISMKHNPDLKRLWKGFKTGRIEFYPKDFRGKKIGEVKSH